MPVGLMVWLMAPSASEVYLPCRWSRRISKRVRAEALTVSFASGKTDHTGDESDDEFDDALGLTCPDDPESDGLESGDDLDDFY